MGISFYLKILIELGKVRISLPIALSALTGYVIFTGKIDFTGLLLVIGVFLFSAGSSAFNHIQEHKIDAQMPRTKGRPIPSGKISVKGAIMVALVYVLSGSVVLYLFQPVIALWISLATLVSYNLIYTPLKKVTAFAVVPGSVIGALPPVIGWTAAGGAITDHTILIVATFFFIGQIPHFWLLLLMFGDQYKLAGMPSLTQVFSGAQIKRVTFTWFLTTVGSAFLVLFYVFNDQILFFILLLYVFYLLFSFILSFLVQKEFNPKPAFYKLNFLYLFMMIFLIIDGIIKN